MSVCKHGIAFSECRDCSGIGLRSAPAACSVATHEMLQAAINKGIELRWLPHYCQHDRHMKDWAMMEECLNAALSKQPNENGESSRTPQQEK